MSDQLLWTQFDVDTQDAYYKGLHLFAHADGSWRVTLDGRHQVDSSMQAIGRDMYEAKQRATAVAINWPR